MFHLFIKSGLQIIKEVFLLTIKKASMSVGANFICGTTLTSIRTHTHRYYNAFSCEGTTPFSFSQLQSEFKRVLKKGSHFFLLSVLNTSFLLVSFPAIFTSDYHSIFHLIFQPYILSCEIPS